MASGHGGHGIHLSYSSARNPMGSRRSRRKCRIVAKVPRNERGEIGPWLDRTGGADQPARAVERAAFQLAGEQAMLLIGSGQPQRAGLRAGEAEPRVV